LLPDESMALRKAAFSALDGYASTLLALVRISDERDHPFRLIVTDHSGGT